MTRIKRLLHLIQLVQEDRPCTIETLCSELDASRRTVFRDLKVLEAAGLPCRFDSEARRYVIQRNALLPGVMLDLEEALALMVQTRKALHSRVVPGHRAALAAALKIEAALPPQLLEHCGEMLAGVDVRYWPMSDAESIKDVLSCLQEALGARRKVAVRYDSYAERREIDTVLHIYRLRFVRRAWYTIAFSEMHDEARTFKIERMTDVRTLDDTYSMDQDFDLEEYYGNAWQMIRGDRRYHVVVRFSPKVADNVEEIAWHKTQQTRRSSDGSLIFKVDVDGVSEIAWWVLGYGKEAVVEQPAELRDIITGHVRAMAEHYDDNRAEERPQGI